ncbi:oxygen-dependent protoporphyrinogen oxidase [Ciborinia camelliae]|nr:oxygen-dependent protoporphyrinogen oxidase [Ciborinia camelliae]
MRMRLPESSLLAPLRRCYNTPQCQAVRLRRWALLSSYTRAYSSQTRPQLCTRERSQPLWKYCRSHVSSHTPTERSAEFKSEDASTEEWKEPSVAVIGGGITGLATAYYLTQMAPHLKITLYEESERLGGWLRTKHIDMGDGEVVFEQGPRTLRPNTPAGFVTLNLIRDLGLTDQVITTGKSSPAALNRFVYYPDRLVCMPEPTQGFYAIAWKILTEPVFKGMFNTLFEYKRPRRPLELEDESVGSFLVRRTGGTDLPDNLVSAVFHGIYGGDIYKMSAKSILPTQWGMEGAYGSISAGIPQVKKFRNATAEDEEMEKKEKSLFTDNENAIVNDASVYTFRRGISTLSEALESSLRSNPNVKIKLGECVGEIKYDDESDGIKIYTGQTGKLHATHSYAISTISARTLSTKTSSSDDDSLLPSLAETESVTVMVVNLYYRDEDLLPERGFGYLIPRSIPVEQNPEFALGVVFDSEATDGQDTIPGTKVTVMLGGHWWDCFTEYPDEEEGASMAKSVLKRHLMIDEEPEMVHVSLQKDCIPQYTVGHEQRLEQAHYELLIAYKGRLAVAGNSYTGVGVNDCIKAAKVVASDVARGNHVTGLERFTEQKWWERLMRQGPTSN